MKRWIYMHINRSGTPDSDSYSPTLRTVWGDFLKENVPYVVNLSFDEINLLNVVPDFPYHLPEKPWVNYWFHTGDGGVVESFNALLREENLDRLEREGGVAIVYTHFGKSFYRDGELDPTFRERIEDVAARDGWFVPAGEILDFLRAQRGDEPPGWRERLRLETLWLSEKALRGSS